MIENNILIEERVRNTAKLFLEGKGFDGTVRGVAKTMDRSKSSVYDDLTILLLKYDKALATGEVYNKLMQNKRERYMRGGLVSKKSCSKF